MKIQWMSQEIAEKLLPTANAALISIVNPGGVRNLPVWEHRLDLDFNDISHEYPGYVHFTPAMAEQILDFIDTLPEHITEIYIHCRQGISRSATVGIFLQEKYGLPFDAKYTFLNPLIWKTLKSVAA